MVWHSCIADQGHHRACGQGEIAVAVWCATKTNSWQQGDSLCKQNMQDLGASLC